MFTKIELFNQALTAIGNAARVTDPDSTTEKSAALCSLWFKRAVLAVTSAHHWPCVRKTAKLALVRERDSDLDWANSDPEPGYLYAYTLPPDCVQPQYLTDLMRFEVTRLGAAKVLCTNSARPILRYSIYEANVALWDIDFYAAVQLTLAAFINMATNGKLQLTQKLENDARLLLENASMAMANQEDTYFEAVPSTWNGTGFSIPVPQATYYYPTQTLRVTSQ